MRKGLLWDWWGPRARAVGGHDEGGQRPGEHPSPQREKRWCQWSQVVQGRAQGWCGAGSTGLGEGGRLGEGGPRAAPLVCYRAWASEQISEKSLQIHLNVQTTPSRPSLSPPCLRYDVMWVRGSIVYLLVSGAGRIKYDDKREVPPTELAPFSLSCLISSVCSFATFPTVSHCFVSVTSS